MAGNLAVPLASPLLSRRNGPGRLAGRQFLAKPYGWKMYTGMTMQQLHDQEYPGNH
jgi:hypothetical protein